MNVPAGRCVPRAWRNTLPRVSALRKGFASIRRQRPENLLALVRSHVYAKYAGYILTSRIARDAQVQWAGPLLAAEIVQRRGV